MKMNRRTMLKVVGGAALGLALPNDCSCTNERKPLAHILLIDNYLEKGKMTRGWHVYWADERNPESKLMEHTRNLERNYRSKVKRLAYYSIEEFPEPVKHAVTLGCPLAPPLTSYPGFSCFRTYSLGPPKDGLPSLVAGWTGYGRGHENG